MDDFEETFVLDDLLSFLSCKLNKFPRDILFKRIRDFYSPEIISSSLKTLLESLPSSYDFPDKQADPLEVMFECLQILPEEDKPVFLCRNLDNVPKLTGEQTYTNEWRTEALRLKSDQEKMKQQLERINSHVQILQSRFHTAQEKILNNFPQTSPEEEENEALKIKREPQNSESDDALIDPPQSKFTKSDIPKLAAGKVKIATTPIAKKIVFVQEKGKLRMLKPSA